MIKDSHKDKNIIVFGATGKTGHQIVRYALEKGYHVTAFVRDKSRLNLKYNNLKIVKGNVLNIKDVDRAISNQNIVISSLGSKPGQPTVCCPGIKNILQAMQKFKVKKLIAVSAHGVRAAGGVYGRILNFILKKQMQDKNEMEELIEKSKTDWTVVRPPVLTNGGHTDNYNLLTDQSLKGLRFISREDTARFIIDSLEKRNYKNKFVTIYS
ncbi:MAG: SDR family oxidoreductase [Spirochaetia bacterium]|nr:SDR family oxidoreductase [Spirochaetia bacterium]